MGGLGIASVPHLTITSPLVNRLCSSCWNYKRCQSPHKGCCLALASKLIIREKTQALTQVGWFRACNKQHPHSDALCIPRSYLHDNLPSSFPTLAHGWEVPFYTFSYPTPECALPAGACVMSIAGSDPMYQPSTRVHIPSVGWKHWGYGWPRDSNPGPLRRKLSTLPLWAIQTTLCIASISAE